MITEKHVIGKIEILEDGKIQVREDRVIYDNDIELTRLYHRYVLTPGDDTRDKDPKIQAVSKLIWGEK
jgi:hypothetical protein